MHHHKAFVIDVYTYFQNHRPWKNGRLEHEEDHMLFTKAQALMDDHENYKKIIPVAYDEFAEEDEEYIDAEENADKAKAEAE